LQRIEGGSFLREADGIPFKADLTSATIARDGGNAFADKSNRQVVLFDEGSVQKFRGDAVVIGTIHLIVRPR